MGMTQETIERDYCPRCKFHTDTSWICNFKKGETEE